MEPWVLSLILATLAFTLAASSSAVRSILRTIFRRPRATTVIVKVDGKRLEFTGTQAAQDFIDWWAAQPDPKGGKPQGGKAKRQARVRTQERASGRWERRYRRERGAETVTKRKDESAAVTGGEVDE